MEYRTTIDLPVSAERAWATLADVRAWPEWTPTVESVATDPGALHVGQSIALKQPGRKMAHYTVDLLDRGARFRWGSNAGGVRQAADHVVQPTGAESCRVVLTFAMSGPLGAVLGRLASAKIRRMVDTEAAGLTARLSASNGRGGVPSDR